jgi:pyruvate,water dikinase
MTYNFPGKNRPLLSEVGGKGLSLILGSQAGLPVPSGFILPVSFFAPWFEELKNTAQWSDFINTQSQNLEKACDALRQKALGLSFSEKQNAELAGIIGKYQNKSFFAVRSSSPEEDLEGSSFAGGYETILGVTLANIKPAIQKAFASCLDYRVAVYKKENGFDATDPKIAIIVQEQVDSEIAGVGFSLNPVTNNFDDAVFTANWGLGETVVAGLATPDTYIVDKVTMSIKNRNLGKKETSIWLAPQGNTEEKPNFKSAQFTLDDKQVLELTNLITKVEALYKKPIDIEWAYSKNKLYLLQARPITAYFSLPAEIITTPGVKKRLYLDVTSSFEALSKPISVAGSSFFTSLVRHVGKTLFFRDITKDINTAIPWVSAGRLYINLSNLFRLVDRKKALNILNTLDSLAAGAISSTNEHEYRSEINKLKILPFGFITKAPGIVWQIIAAKYWPESTNQRCQKQMRAFAKNARALAKQNLSCVSLADKLLSSLLNEVIWKEIPLFIAGKMALGNMKKIAEKNLLSKFDPLEVALPNNVTTQMGLALYDMSEILPKNLSPEEIEVGLIKNTLSVEFVSAWKNFIDDCGHRGPNEIDIAAPRYRDNHELLISTLLAIQSNSKSDNLREKFARNQEASRKTYEYLLGEVQKTKPSKVKRFQLEYKTFETFAGYRETHKFYLVLVADLLRQRVLECAKRLYESERIQSIEQIFDLKLEEIDEAMRNPSLDLLKIAKENKIFIEHLAHPQRTPSVIDSRGFIPHPPSPPIHKGEVQGTPISPGIVRGQIKILHSPNEKPFLKGEILVARATDPGWTPLFANAAAVILEVGGVLQHGALVAREYGLPCVAGVENATTLWKDGTLVEVDGSTGIIRLTTKN